MATKQRSFRLTSVDNDRLTELAKLWGGIRPLPDSEVVREALRRALDNERSASRQGPGEKPSDES